METTNFVYGLFISKREKAPDFLITSLSFTTEKFIEYLKNHTNAKGYCNIDVLMAKSGKPYAKLNDWKPGTQGGYQEPELNEEQIEILKGIPF